MGVHVLGRRPSTKYWSPSGFKSNYQRGQKKKKLIHLLRVLKIKERMVALETVAFFSNNVLP